MKPKSLFRSSLLAMASAAATMTFSYAQTVEINPAGAIPSGFTLAPSGTWDWDTDADLEGWAAGGNGAFVLDAGTPVGGFVTGTSATGTGAAGDANFTSPITTIATPYRVIVEFRINKEASDDSRIDLFWDDTAGGFGGPRVYSVTPGTFGADGNYKVVRITFPVDSIKTQLDRLRIDPIAEAANVGKTVGIDYVRVYTETLTPLTWDADLGTSGAQGGSGSWDQAITANWWNGAANTTWPGSGPSAIFTDTPGTVTVSGTVDANVLEFQTTGAGTGYTLGGGIINLGSVSAVFDNTSPDNISTRINSELQGSAPLLLREGANNSTFVFGGNSSSFSGPITQTNNFIGFTTDTALGTGTFTAGNGANTFISALDGDRTIPNNVVFGGNRMLIDNNDRGTGLAVGNLTIGGNLALNGISPGDLYLRRNLTVDGVVSGSNSGFGLFFAGNAGTMRLNSANTFSGGIRFDTGTTLEVAADNRLGNAANGLLFKSGGTNGGTVRMLAAFGSARNMTLSGAGVGQIDTNGFDSTFSGVVSGLITDAGSGTIPATGAAQLRKLGAGTLTLTGAGSALGAGGIRVDDGTLEIGTGATITSGNSTANGVSAGGTLRVNGGAFQSNNIAVGIGAGTGTFTLDSGTYNNGAEFIIGWTGDGVFNVNGGVATLNQLSLTNAEPFTSTLNLNGGTLALNFFNARANLVTPATATINFNGSTVTSRSNQADFIETNSTTEITVNVGAGGANFNTAGFNVTINEPLLHDPALGATLDGGLTKFSPGTLTLNAANTYTGDTVVSGGVLAVNGSSIADTGKLVINAAVVEPTGTEDVDTLFFGTTQQFVGTWGAPGSGADFIDDTKFAGTAGVVNVLNGPIASGYDAWAAAFTSPPLSDTAATADPDNDGIQNIVEYGLGTDPRFSSVPAGVYSGNDITYTKGAEAIANGDVSWTIQTSPDLSTWSNTVSQPAGDPAADIVYTFTPGSPTKQFARLKVIQNP